MKVFKTSLSVRCVHWVRPPDGKFILNISTILDFGPNNYIIKYDEMVSKACENTPITLKRITPGFTP